VQSAGYIPRRACCPAPGTEQGDVGMNGYDPAFIVDTRDMRAADTARGSMHFQFSVKDFA
jgi:hypothetical protein